MPNGTHGVIKEHLKYPGIFSRKAIVGECKPDEVSIDAIKRSSIINVVDVERDIIFDGDVYYELP